MGITDAIKSCTNKYATFSGRAPRSEYWWFRLFVFLTEIMVSIAFGVIGFLCGDILGAAFAYWLGIILAAIVFFLPSLAVLVRRLHDTGHSGWWYFIVLVPLIGYFWFLYLMIKGSDDENEYGLPVY